MVLGAAAIRCGDAALAAQAVENLKRVLPNAALSHPISKVFRDPARRDALIDALRDAGLPGHANSAD